MKERILLVRLILLLAIIVICLPAGAQEFRSFKRIATPAARPGKAVPVDVFQPVETTQAKSDLESIFQDWNQGGKLEQHIGEEFYNRSNFHDAMAVKVPRNADLRVLSVQGVQTLEQFRQPSPDGRTTELVSVVSVNATTEIEFEDPTRGYRRLPGTNEYILRITEEIVK